MILFNNALFYGGTEKMIDDAVTINTGHLQIHHKGFYENQTMDNAFIPGDGLLSAMDELKSKKIIKGYSMRVQADALVSFNDTASGAVIQSIDLEKEKQLTTLHTKILPGGRGLKSSDRKSVLMGATLAKNMGAGVNSVITVMTQGFDGSICAEKLTVAGLFKSANPAYDQRLILMPHAQAVETFAMENFVHSILISITRPSDAPEVMKKLKDVTDSSTIEILGWKDLIPDIVQFAVIDISVGYIFAAILFLVVALTVLNTIQMSVFERTREFGVMLSVGTEPEKVFSIIMLESVFITVTGIVAGLILGAVICTFFKYHPIDYSRYASEFALYGVYTTAYPAVMTALNVITTAVVIFVSSLLFSILPARRASKLNPVDAVRHL